MLKRLIIHATNVHQGGGRSLLYALLCAVPKNLGLIALLDTRMEVPEMMPENKQIKRVRPSLSQRMMAEWWLAKNSMLDDVILCFGNLPPLFRPRGHVIVFLQNRYILDNVKLTGFPIKTKLRISMERLWFFMKAKYVNEFIVQTPSMKTLVESKLGANVPIHVVPFVMNKEGYSRNSNQDVPKKNGHYDFLYVASGEPHKNHRLLVEAWCLLAVEGLFPSLCLTVSAATSPDLYNWIEDKKNKLKLHLENMGSLPHGQIAQLYDQATALIYPSTFESFGLPLIEARQAGLSIVAAELDYVRDILDPEQSFDPGSALSIVRAVKRFMGVDEQPLMLLDADSFVKYIMKEG